MALKMQAVALQTTLFLINQFVLMFLYYMLEMVILALKALYCCFASAFFVVLSVGQFVLI